MIYPTFHNFLGLKSLYLILLALGCALFGILVLLTRPLPITATPQWVYIKIAGAALAGLLLRSLRRKVFFGFGLTLHQSISFEVIAQWVQFFSPLLPRRAFEVEFMIRETTQKIDLIDSWLRSRTLSTYVVVLLGFAWLAWLYSIVWLSVLMLMGALAVFGLRLVHHTYAFRTVWTVLSGIIVWSVEGGLFVWASEGMLDKQAAWTIYLLFTGMLEFSPVPLGVGLGQIPAILTGAGAAMWLLICFHLGRLLPLVLLGLLYLARYKFAMSDFFDPNVIAAIKKTQRPEGGWRFTDEIPSDRPFISIIIPAYNEAKRLPAFLQSVRDYMNRRDLAIEVLTVDDGSTDNTACLVRQVAAEDSRIRLLQQTPNQGKGAAVRRGVFAARGRYVLFTDADGAIPIRELDKFILLARQDEEVIIGSRQVNSPAVKRQRKGLRALMGMVFYRTVNLLAVPGIHDTQCGFKMFRRDVARALFKNVVEKGWAFDVEVLYLAQLVGFAVNEIAVAWQAIEGSKINPIKDSIKMFGAIFRIRNRHKGFLHHVRA